MPADDSPRLFDAEDLRLRPTGAARLRRLAGLPPRSATGREKKTEEDREILARIRGWGADLASRFDLPLNTVEPERDGVVSHYGICYEDGLIRIRLRHATTGRLLKESSLVDTLCHELAHLQHLDHSVAFQRLYARILAEARRLGWYRPGPVADSRPRQGMLFGETGCGVRSARPGGEASRG